MTDDLRMVARSHSESALRSLAPSYDASQHETYVKRLRAAVQRDSNRNIALTGSYGTGKSSVLDEFCRELGSDALRLNISTLGANNEDTTLTNRLQKEVVKQLLYSERPTALRNSRFKRIRSLTRQRAAIEAVSTTLVVGLLLFLTGNMPSIVGTEPGRRVLTQVAAWSAAGIATALIVMVVRLATFDRFVVSTLGGAITLKEDTSTYFDEYLDEIVHYFDTSDKQVVVFEDLDRFDDPLIFEALRELNTLLNNTAQRRSKDTPLRFVYAVKDSLFERLGKIGRETEADANAAKTGAAEAETDAAAAENERANRTKFFDLVIPVVPFISHRNARELLADLLAEAQITGVDRTLVDLVAKHTTDMRLLVNLRNEYLVFAERLLDSDRVAPDLAPSHLFALVAYKMFHMEDFERIAQRSSRLDGLYADSRDIVQQEVNALRKRLRGLSRGRGRAHSRASRALAAGTRLSAMANAVAAAATPRWPSQSTLRFDVDGVPHEADAVTTPSFWASVATADALTAQHSLNNQQRTLFTLTRQGLDDALPEASDADAWDDVNERDLQAELTSIETDIAKFRGAGFEELLRLSDAFSAALDARLTSDMARELVRQGYLTRHFATYAAQFYGHFTGVDVVTFIMQTVETNSVDIDYEFTTSGAVANLLSETNDGFTKTVSALNIDVLNFLLREEDPRRDDVARQIINRLDENSQAFLSSYLTAGANPEGLVRRLAALGWPDVLLHLAADDGVPDDARSRLVDAALTALDSVEKITLGDSVKETVIRNHAGMSAFTTNSDARVARGMADLIDRLDWTVPDLAPMSETLQGLLVERSLYDVTASNLRLAAAEPNISLDTLSATSNVYDHALASPGRYLAAVAEDGPTSHAIESSATLIRVLNDVGEGWTEQDVVGLLAATSGDSCLTDIREAPQRHWDALADADLVQPSLSNVSAFLDHSGVITAPLGNLLLRTRRVDHDVDDDTDSNEMKARTAVEIINADDHITSLEDRINIASTLALIPKLPAESIDASDTTLLASLLVAGLVNDTLDVFLELKPPDWSGMDAALRASKSADQFATPELLHGYVEQILASPTHRDRFGPRIIRELSSFAEDDDHGALLQAGKYALETGTRLPIEEVRRVARASAVNPRLTVRLLHKMHLALPPAELAAVLASLGAPYTRLTAGGSHFDVPYDEEFRAVFDRLKAGGICDARKRPRKDKLRVTPAG